MDSDLGSLLLEIGAITTAQLTQALSLRHKNGGLLLAHLLTAGGITEDQVVNLFCTKRAFRRAAEVDITQVPAEMLAYVPAHLAQRYAVLPLSVEGDILYIAAADPSDTQVQAEVAYVTGHRVVPLVARYSVITEAIKKYYSKDAPLPPSFPPPYDPYADGPWHPHRETDNEFFTAVKEKTNTVQGMGAQRGAPRFYVSTRETGLGQPEQNPIRLYAIPDPNQEAPQQTLRGMGQDLDPTPTIVQASAFLQGFQDDDTPTIPSLRSVRAPDEKQTEGPKIRKILKPLAPPPTIEAFFPAPDDLLADLKKADRVEAVLDLVFGYLSYAYPRQLFLLNKPGLLQGFRGSSLPCEASELKVPLNAPSLFTSVILSQYPYVGAVTLTRATRGLLRSLGYPCYAVLLPIQVGSRTIGVFLGDQGEPMRSADTHTFIQLQQLTNEASQAFVRILQQKKRLDALEQQLKLSEESSENP